MPKHPPDAVDQLLDQWRAQLPDLPTKVMGLAARLGRVTALGEKEIERELGKFGLKLGEFDVLAGLRRAGLGAALTPTDLYKQLMLSSGAMTNRLDRLEEAGLIERRDDPRDGRSFRVALTRKGKELVERAVVAHVANEERFFAKLTAAERDALDGLLRKLLAS